MKKTKKNSKKKSNFKFDFKLMFSVIMFLFVILGSAAAFFLSQQSQDVRNQAYDSFSLVKCNSQCNPRARKDLCNQANKAWSCIAGRCRLTTDPTSKTCGMETITIYSCNSDCTTNAQCSGINPNWSCVNNKCRLTIYPSSTKCQTPIPTPTPTVKPTPTPSPTPSPSPEILLGCNQTHCNDADRKCLPGLSCINNRCRLETNPTSPTCVKPK